MEVYKDLSNPASKEFENLLNNQLSKINIEEGKIDQHEGSFLVGTLLKKIYVDSALRKADMINQQHAEDEKPEPIVDPLPISWKEFKNARKR